MGCLDLGSQQLNTEKKTVLQPNMESSTAARHTRRWFLCLACAAQPSPALPCPALLWTSFMVVIGEWCEQPPINTTEHQLELGFHPLRTVNRFHTLCRRAHGSMLLCTAVHHLSCLAHLGATVTTPVIANSSVLILRWFATAQKSSTVAKRRSGGWGWAGVGGRGGGGEATLSA